MCQKRFPSVDEIRLHCEEHRREAEKVQNKSIPEVEDEIVCLDDSIGMISNIFFFNLTTCIQLSTYVLIKLVYSSLQRPRLDLNDRSEPNSINGHAT